MESSEQNIFWFDSPHSNEISLVGGKNASLGEMIKNLGAHGIAIPMGFATSTAMYTGFLQENNLIPQIQKTLTRLNKNTITLRIAGAEIRKAILEAQWSKQATSDINKAYNKLNDLLGSKDTAVAVRSSATAEDLPEASFAGQQESFLNIRGEVALLNACKQCYASLFTDRAISYRIAHDFDHLKVALSIGVQQMIQADTGSSGVIFTLDTETGFNQVINVSSSWGLGENIVKGTVDPDEFCVFKPLLANNALVPIVDRRLGSKKLKMIYGTEPGKATKNVATSDQEQSAFSINDNEVLKLALWASQIEKHYRCPMDIEWAKDGETKNLFIVQARPETVQSRQQNNILSTYHITSKKKKILSGIAIGQKIVAAPVCLIQDIKDIERFVDGSILVTKTTDPDWVPLMKRASAIVTDHGSRTSHAAIVSRELGLPAILGTEHATNLLEDKQEITVSCAEGDMGFVYQGKAEYTTREIDLSQISTTKTRVMLNLADPATAFRWWRLPADGIGLVRMEFVINNHVKVHPMALLHFEDVQDEAAQLEIQLLTRHYTSKSDYFVELLANGLARFAALAYPQPAIIRMSDFKTNEYANLLGGAAFEPKEENPMLGFRGASRYYSPEYREAFALECQAVKKIREEMGFRNVIVMIPFCRTLDEAEEVIKVMAENNLVRGQNELEIYMMCEIPSNVILARKFARYFDGFSIGSNDLTQLTLGVDRDSSKLSALFSEQNEAVLWMIKHAIQEGHAGKAKVGLCGQAPSDHPEFAEFLVKSGIDSISVSPDSFFAVKNYVAESEQLKDQERL